MRQKGSRSWSHGKRGKKGGVGCGRRGKRQEGVGGAGQTTGREMGLTGDPGGEEEEGRKASEVGLPAGLNGRAQKEPP